MKMYVTSFALMAALAALTGCGSDSPNSPSGAVTQIYTASLQPSQEVPSVNGSEATGGGTATITVNLTKDASGNVTSATANFAVTLNGFPAATPINMAHIHVGGAGQSGDVVVNTTIAPGDVVLTNGSGSFNKSAIAVPADIASQLMNGPSGFYFNVHSTLNPSGVARGQLVRVQ